MEPKEPRARLSWVTYLGYQALGSILVNAPINWLALWPQRHRLQIGVWGGFGSAAFDTVLTALLLTFLTVVNGSYFVRLDLARGLVAAGPRSAGSWPNLPGRAVPRALALTAIVAPFGSAFGLAWLALGPEQLSLREFSVFKVSFACLLGVVVTPLNAHAMITSEPPSREAGR
ncbi:MAG TPA: hypothetical protein VLC09_21025 [Polyangiaceae bacterium]|nr:hypothetical protein [Polyangiaceae bacterium]